jgi:hypothetical protein
MPRPMTDQVENLTLILNYIRLQGAGVGAVNEPIRTLWLAVVTRMQSA